MTKPLCIYIASRLSIPPAYGRLDKEDIRFPAKVITGYFYNLRQSLKAAKEIMRKGHYPFVPGLDFLLYLELDEEDPELPYDRSLEWLRRCDAVLILSGLENSPGVQREHEEAKKLNKKIFYSVKEIPDAQT